MSKMEGVGIFQEEFAVKAVDFHVWKFGNIEGGGLLEGRTMGAENCH